MKKILLTALAVIVSLSMSAQNATNSPYSQYGYGMLADQANGATVAMGGAKLGWREGNQVNFGNPASYSCIDSITFIFDAGISGQVTNFKEGTTRLNATNSSFDYVIGAFRVARHMGMAFGMMPYTNIGYDYYNQETIGTSTATGDTKTIVQNTYAGSGGYHQVFLGYGIEPIHTKNTSFSIGANLSYLWGSSSRSIVNAYSDSYVNTLSKYYTSDVKSYKLDLGAQLQHRFSKTDMVTVGISYSNGHKIASDPTCRVISTNSQTSVTDTTTYKSDRDISLPTTYGIGLTWNHKNRWRVSFDYGLEKWASLDYPLYTVTNDVAYYKMTSGQFKDRHKFAIGADFVAKQESRNYFNRVHLRAGAFYNTPYLKINGQTGPKEYGLSFGFGLPITNSYNNRSLLNLSAQWTRMDATNMIKENTFRINIGLTFNERWFAKWQLE